MSSTPTIRLKLYGQEPHTYARRCDLPSDQREPFNQWMVEEGIWHPILEGTPASEQDAFYIWDYARWRVEDLRHDPKEVVHGEMFTGLVVTVRDIVLALPEENLAAFARQQAEHTRCSNLLDVTQPTDELMRLSTGYYLREFRGWREAASAVSSNAKGDASS